MKSIYKYGPICNTPGIPHKVAMPPGAVILSVQYQAADKYYGGIFIWAVVDIPPISDPTVTVEARTFISVGTGWDVQDHFMDNAKHLATVQSGDFVWHVFEILAPKEKT